MTAHDTMQQPLQHIVFDMGGVLMTFDAMFFAQQYTTCDEDAQLLARAYFLRTEWALLDSGTITPATMVRIAEASLPERLHPALHACAASWQHHSQPLTATNELAARLKQRGFTLYLLSNASSELHKYFHRIPGSECFMGKIVSADVKLLKPMHEIYERLYSDFDLKPEECWFVDDSPTNVECARCTGMGGSVFYNDAKRFRRELIEQGLDLTEE